MLFNSRDLFRFIVKQHFQALPKHLPNIKSELGGTENLEL